MKLAMIMSQKRLAEEYGMLNRLAVGLLNDYANIIRVIPKNKNEAFDEHENAVSIAQRLEVEMPTAWINRRNRKTFGEMPSHILTRITNCYYFSLLDLLPCRKMKVFDYLARAY